jgi:tetratricopeptide (TPR) repeat protein
MFCSVLIAAALAIPYDIDVTVVPAGRTLTVSGTMLLPSAQRVELSLRTAFALTASNARVERGATTGKITTWIVEPRERKLRFSCTATQIEHQDLLHVGDDVAFTTANESPWYPIVPGSSGIGTIRFHVPPGFVVAAPGNERKSGEFVVEVPSRFWFAAGRYITFRAAASSAYLLRSRAGVSSYLDGIDRILRVLSHEFGPYRYGRFLLVEVPRAAAEDAGGFNAFGSAGGIVTRSAALDVPFNVAYYAHEIGHQWWSNLISLRADSVPGNYMMDEALAQFASMRAVESLEGEVAAARYRRSGYPGFHDDLYCYCAAGYFRMAAAGFDRSLGLLPEDNISDRLSRNKGALVWSMLADAVGRERFRDILRRFIREHAFEEVTWSDLLDSIRRGAGRDVEWFFKQWFDGTGAPSFTVEWSQEGEVVHVAIRQPPPFFRASLQVEIRGALSSKTIGVDATDGETLLVARAGFPVIDVQIDPHDRVLRWTPEMRADAEAARPYILARQLLSEDRVDEAERALRDALQNLPSTDTYGARFLAEYGLTNVLLRRKLWLEAREHAEAALATPTRRPEMVPVVYLRYATILKELSDLPAARRAIDDGLSAASVAPQPAATDAAEALRLLARRLPQ